MYGGYIESGKTSINGHLRKAGGREAGAVHWLSVECLSLFDVQPPLHTDLWLPGAEVFVYFALWCFTRPNEKNTVRAGRRIRLYYRVVAAPPTRCAQTHADFAWIIWGAAALCRGQSELEPSGLPPAS
jgi:hypothetical protein